jgi:hypothetical protein
LQQHGPVQIHNNSDPKYLQAMAAIAKMGGHTQVPQAGLQQVRHQTGLLQGCHQHQQLVSTTVPGGTQAGAAPTSHHHRASGSQAVRSYTYLHRPTGRVLTTSNTVAADPQLVLSVLGDGWELLTPFDQQHFGSPEGTIYPTAGDLVRAQHHGQQRNLQQRVQLQQLQGGMLPSDVLQQQQEQARLLSTLGMNRQSPMARADTPTLLQLQQALAQQQAVPATTHGNISSSLVGMGVAGSVGGGSVGGTGMVASMGPMAALNLHPSASSATDGMSAVGHTMSGIPVGQQQLRRAGMVTLPPQHQHQHHQGAFDAQLLRAALASSGVPMDAAAKLVLMAANAPGAKPQAPQVPLSSLSSTSLSTNSAATTSTGSPFFRNTASSLALTPRDSANQFNANSNSMVVNCSSPASLAMLNSMAALDLNSLAASMSHQQQLHPQQQNMLQGLNQGLTPEGVSAWLAHDQQQMQGGAAAASWDMICNALQSSQQ